MKRQKRAGVYIHIPFCERLCPYCDFAVSVKVEIPHEEYACAISRELSERRGELEGHQVQTVYLGGGTPSLLRARELKATLETVDELFDLTDDVEVTMEANPNQVSSENLACWRAAGINRLSIGCQSFHDRHLKALRRTHNGDEARRAVELALGVMDRVSLDLMFAGPSQPLEEWKADLEIIKELVVESGLDHLSGYNLTIEPGTAFWIRRKRGTVVVPDDDMAALMLELLVEAAEAVGLRRYEVSNFAVDGGESRHNSSYWQGVPYLGVGVGAHSLELLEGGGARRRANPRRYDDYMASAGGAQTVEELSPVEHLGERLFLGGRSSFGIQLEELRGRFSKVDEEVFEKIEKVLTDLVERGWMVDDGKRFAPSAKGLNFSDSLAQWLFGVVG